MIRLLTLFLALLLPVPLALAGDPNPPPGPVAPTMHTLQEIWDAIDASAGGELADDRQGAPWIASSRGTAFLSIPGVSGPDTTPDGIIEVIRLIDFRELISAPGGGQAQHQVFSFIKEIDKTTIAFKEFATKGFIVNPTILFYDSETPGTLPNLRIDLNTAYTTGTKALGRPAAGDQHHLELITMVFEQANYQWLQQTSASAITPPPGPIAPTMHTLEEIHTAVTMALPLDDRTVGADFIAEQRLEAYLEVPSIPGPDETPDQIRDVIALLEFCDPLTLSVMNIGGGQEPQVGIPEFPGLRVAMELDGTTIAFRDALFQGTNLGLVILHVYKLDSNGIQLEYFRVTLHDAAVTELDSTRRAHGRVLRHVEEIVLLFRMIEWEFFPEMAGPLHWGWDRQNNIPFP